MHGAEFRGRLARAALSDLVCPITLRESATLVLDMVTPQIVWFTCPQTQGFGQVERPCRPAALFDATFPNQYSELSRNQTARHAASSWTQSGHLSGRARKTRHRIKPTAVAVAMALFLGNIAGYHGAAVFSNPWCCLLDLSPERAKAFGIEAHRAGLINLRAVGEVVELSFPLLAEFQEPQP
jgi:hypothetical protein